ncbi:DUF4129 domain-containing protein [Catenulispora subtropica]|uniref:Protein-glutamine gamma-glutamyltransferase-like C-terminal domain-containing protein n=1 Tax=Catenulispora subtropica TaxID=450798 RepID=A0ABP5CDD6_9ACTN
MIDPGTPVTPPSPGVPIVVGRDDARRAAADELAKPVYAHARPSLAKRALDWFGHEMRDLWDKAFGSTSGGGGNGWIALLVVLGLLVGLVVVIRLRYGPVRRQVTGERSLFDEDTALDAAGYRRAAEEHAAGGRWAEAVRARLRAVITALEERAVLEPRPGRTADVAAREAGRVLPEQAEALAGAARVFDDIWYGEAAAGPEDYRRLVAVDDAVAAARIRVGAGVGAGTGVGLGADGPVLRAPTDHGFSDGARPGSRPGDGPES